jgi:hypothetical protein
MDRRKSLKTLLIGSVGAGVLVEACTNAEKKAIANGADVSIDADRMQEEKDHAIKQKTEPNFFTKEEMATITVLSDIIIPKDDISGSATDAKVPDFIEFIVKDMPSHQTPLRGGLRWLDLHCLKLYNKTFTACNNKEQIEVVDSIAYPEKAKKELAQGVAFFNRMRDLVTTGFYTSEIGVKDLDYKGNVPNQWNGVPDDVLKQYKIAYSDKELKECVSYDNKP